MARAARSLLRACDQGSDAAAREDMAITSLFGGLALANAGLGAVHGFAGPLGGMFDAPHGAICAALLPHVMTANVAALTARAPDREALSRYDEVARILTGGGGATARDGVEWVKDLCRALDVPSLSTHGMTQDDIPTAVEAAAVASSMKGNPIELDARELTEIMRRAL
jgi:alcohol dehydrogenase class IV